MRKETRRRSGKRPNADTEILEYLARIAVMHEIDSREFFSRIVEAWNREKSKCEQLIIRCRKKMKDSAMFLFTSGGKVVAQFPILVEILQGNHFQLERYVAVSARASSASNFHVVNPKIKDLKAGMKNVNLTARVLEIPRLKMVYTRFGTEAYVSNALIADETGTIRMSLWNRQIQIVSKGDTVKIENGKVARFKGELQLRIGRSGKIIVQRSKDA